MTSKTTSALSMTITKTISLMLLATTALSAAQSHIVTDTDRHRFAANILDAREGYITQMHFPDITVSDDGHVNVPNLANEFTDHYTFSHGYELRNIGRNLWVASNATDEDTGGWEEISTCCARTHSIEIRANAAATGLEARFTSTRNEEPYQPLSDYSTIFDYTEIVYSQQSWDSIDYNAGISTYDAEYDAEIGHDPEARWIALTEERLGEYTSAQAYMRVTPQTTEEYLPQITPGEYKLTFTQIHTPPTGIWQWI